MLTSSISTDWDSTLTRLQVQQRAHVLDVTLPVQLLRKLIRKHLQVRPQIHYLRLILVVRLQRLIALANHLVHLPLRLTHVLHQLVTDNNLKVRERLLDLAQVHLTLQLLFLPRLNPCDLLLNFVKSQLRLLLTLHN